MIAIWRDSAGKERAQTMRYALLLPFLANPWPDHQQGQTGTALQKRAAWPALMAANSPIPSQHPAPANRSNFHQF
jgi:hypothetical protein